MTLYDSAWLCMTNNYMGNRVAENGGYLQMAIEMIENSDDKPSDLGYPIWRQTSQPTKKTKTRIETSKAEVEHS